MKTSPEWGRRKLVPVACSLLFFCAQGLAQGVEFNYEGRVKVGGETYTGDGYFKFAILNTNKSITLWSNDGTSLTGNEPAAAVIAPVTDGVFNVVVGDTSLANMDVLPASVFNTDANLFLRVWFSDQPVSGFERLNPDRKITNKDVLGSVGIAPLDLYVNPATGNDAYPGLVPSRPKRTIQSAWDVIPPLVKAHVTLHLADGTYRESAELTGKTTVGDTTITILGNPTTPTAVRITGADAGADTTPVRMLGFFIYRQESLALRGLSIDYFGDEAIRMLENTHVTVNDCVVDHCPNGVMMGRMALGFFTDCTFANGKYGVSEWSQAHGRMEGCEFHGLDYGVIARHATSYVYGCDFHDLTNGVYATAGSYVMFEQSGGANSTMSNYTTGTFGNQNSVIHYATTYVTYDGSGTNTSSSSGAVWYP